MIMTFTPEYIGLQPSGLSEHWRARVTVHDPKDTAELKCTLSQDEVSELEVKHDPYPRNGSVSIIAGQPHLPRSSPSARLLSDPGESWGEGTYPRVVSALSGSFVVHKMLAPARYVSSRSITRASCFKVLT